MNWDVDVLQQNDFLCGSVSKRVGVVKPNRLKWHIFIVNDENEKKHPTK